MQSSCGRYVIAFNGEIYNFRALRQQLLDQGVSLRTEGDTEVLLELFARKGANMLSSLRGMFAFFIWDRHEQRGFAARDPYGIKPLYIAKTRHGYLVGSQVRSLMATGLVSFEPSPEGQAGYWLLGSVPEPYTWFRDVWPVRAGHFLSITPFDSGDQQCWWDISADWREAPNQNVGDAEIQERIHQALRDSAAHHLVADVPIGVFLSGGIDSGSVAGLMSEAGARDLEGITIAYREYVGTSDDEVPMAALTAKHYGIHHHVRIVTASEFSADFDRILESMDQPSIDGVNTWYASKAVAERGLKVVMSGTGGDELFQGYQSFRQLPKLISAWRVMSAIPGAHWTAEMMCDYLAKRARNARWRYAPAWLHSVGGAWWLRRTVYTPEDLPALMGEDLAAEAERGFSAERHIEGLNRAVHSNHRIALGQIESVQYLRNQLLRDSDWASMYHSVELRTPLVDAWLLKDVAPYLSALERFPQKSLLANAPSRPLPRLALHRRKTGFTVPIKNWVLQQADLHSTHSGASWAQVVVEQYTSSLKL